MLKDADKKITSDEHYLEVIKEQLEMRKEVNEFKRFYRKRKREQIDVVKSEDELDDEFVDIEDETYEGG